MNNANLRVRTVINFQNFTAKTRGAMSFFMSALRQSKKRVRARNAITRALSVQNSFYAPSSSTTSERLRGALAGFHSSPRTSIITSQDIPTVLKSTSSCHDFSNTFWVQVDSRVLMLLKGLE